MTYQYSRTVVYATLGFMPVVPLLETRCVCISQDLKICVKFLYHTLCKLQTDPECWI
jgi:hypothetical protein